MVSARSSGFSGRNDGTVALDDIEYGWKLLAGSRPGGPMQGYAWAAAAQASAPNGLPTVCVVVGDPVAPDAIAALRPTGRWPRELSLSAHGEPIDVLYRDRSALDQLCESLAGLRVPMKFWRLPASSPTPCALAAAAGRRGKVLVRPMADCPVLRLDDSWREPERRFNAGRRSDIRRYRRRAEAAGPTEVELLAPGVDQVDALLDEAVEVESAGWKGRRGTALALDAERQAFFRTWARSAAREGSVRIAFLRVDGRPAAMQLAAESAGRLWLLKVGYDESFAPCSPGFLLMLEVVRAAAGRGLETVEFLGQAEPWTGVWCDEVRPTVGLATYPYSAAGGCAVVRDAVTFARSRVRERREAARP